MGNKPSSLQGNEEIGSMGITALGDYKVWQPVKSDRPWRMKLFILGDCNTGKSSLFQRLQETSASTICTASDGSNLAIVSWGYRTASDYIELEVWDLASGAWPQETAGVASGSERQGRISEMEDWEEVNPPPHDGDSESLSYHQNAKNSNAYHGQVAVLMYNPHQASTWEYIKNQVMQIPNHLNLLFIRNFADLTDRVEVSSEEVKEFMDLNSREALYMQASMLDGFGLKALQVFLNIPFLKMQREALQNQLEINANDINTAIEEYTLVVEHQTHENHLKLLTVRNGQTEVDSDLKNPLKQGNIENTDGGTKSSGSYDPELMHNATNNPSIAMGGGDDMENGHSENGLPDDKNRTAQFQEQNARHVGHDTTTNQTDKLILNHDMDHLPILGTDSYYSKDGNVLEMVKAPLSQEGGLLSCRHVVEVTDEEEDDMDDSQIMGNPKLATYNEDMDEEDFELYTRI